MTETLTNTRVTIENGWAVRSLDDGSQVRARLLVDTMGDTEEPPREGCGVLLVRESDSYGGVDLDEHDGLSAVLDRLYRVRHGEWRVDMVHDGSIPATRTDWRPVGDDDDREEFVRRYLRAFWDVEDAFMFRHHDYRDWADIWVIVESVRPEGWDEDWTISREGAESVVQEWSDWAKGECYGFESQTRTLTDAMCSDPSDPDDGWEDADACWGFIGDSGARYALAEALGVDEADVPAPYEVTTW